MPQTTLGDHLTPEHAERRTLARADDLRQTTLVLGRNPRLFLLCAYALLNPVAAQLAYFFLGNAADQGLSILQLFQGAFLAFAVMLTLRAQRAVPAAKATRRLLVFVALACAIFLLKKAAWGGPDDRGIVVDLVWYSKIVAWSCWWWLVASVVQRREDAERLLRAVIWGALIAAAIAIACYATGIGFIEAYQYEGVAASVGASGVSSKQTVAYLAPAVFLCAYLGRERHPWVGILGALVLLAATLLSYDRSVQVGLAVALTWLLLWRVFAGWNATSVLPIRLFGLVMIFGIALFWFVGFDTLSSRWSYDIEKGMVGSGRSDFYLAAWRSYVNAGVPEWLFGIGMANVAKVMFETVGLEIHTHSDLFDMLLGGGVLGLVVYLYAWRTLILTFRGVSSGSIHFAIMGAYVIVVGTMSVITGLVAAPHAMFCLGATLLCIRVIAAQPKAAPDAPIRAARRLGYFVLGQHRVRP